MINYSVGLKRPFQDLKKLVIGIVISIIPVVNLIAMGYGLRCIKTVVGKKKSYELPEWNQFWDLFVKGLASFVIGIVYLLPGLIVMSVAALSVISSTFIDEPELFIANLFAANIGLMIIAIILLVMGGVLSPIGVINYAKSGQFSSAFKLKAVVRQVTGTYILTWLLVAIYSVVIALIFGIFGLIPYIGEYVGSGVSSFIAMVTTYTWLAEAYIMKK